MNSPFNSEPTFKASADKEFSPPVSGYAPSVPISVYRELATELQATKAVVDSLTTQNQQLVRQNQLLKQEIHKVVHATLQLGQFAGVAQPSTPIEAPALSETMGETNQGASYMAPPPHRERPSRSNPSRSNLSPGGLVALNRPLKSLGSSLIKDRLFSSQTDPSHRKGQSSGEIRDFSGLWVALSILLVVLTAFGAGFLIMRPLLNNR